MTAKDRIEWLQELVGAGQDGVIGKETMSKFAAAFGRTRAQTIVWFANVIWESNNFKEDRENMKYSQGQIMKIFGVGRHSARVTLAESVTLQYKDYELAERVYGIGNPKKAQEFGNLKAGMGWLYRGGGALHCTGYKDYLLYGGKKLAENPGLISTKEFYFSTAIKEFDYKKIWAACKDLSFASVKAARRIVNGGENGLDEVFALVNKLDKIWK